MAQRVPPPSVCTCGVHVSNFLKNAKEHFSFLKGVSLTISTTDDSQVLSDRNQLIFRVSLILCKTKRRGLRFIINGRSDKQVLCFFLFKHDTHIYHYYFSSLFILLNFFLFSFFQVCGCDRIK